MELSLKAALKRRKMKAADLARRLEIDKGYLSHLMTGKREPSFQMLSRILDVLQAEPAEILDTGRLALPAPSLAPPGLSDGEAVPFAHKGANELMTLVDILAPGTTRPTFWRIVSDAADLGLFRDDVVIVDSAFDFASLAPGETVVGNINILPAGRTAFGRYAPPWFVDGRGRPIARIGDDFIVLGVCRASIRAPALLRMLPSQQ